MEENSNDIQLIERYFDNEMSPEEKIQFETRAKNDADFRSIARMEKAIIEAVKSTARERMKKDLQAFSATLPPVDLAKENRRYLFHKYKYLGGTAASLLVLFVVIFALKSLFFSSSSDNLALYEQYFTPIPESNVNTGRHEHLEISWAYDSYRKQNYRAVINYFNELPFQELLPIDVLYLGNAYMMLGEYDKSITVFNDCNCFDSSSAGVEIQWYLALSYMHEGKTNKAILLLNEIIQKGKYPYIQKAKKLLSAME